MACIALNILTSQASSIPCECVFLSSKLTATDRCAWLRAEVFKKLQVLKAVWHTTIINLAWQNLEEIKEVLDEFEDMFLADKEMRQ